MKFIKEPGFAWKKMSLHVFDLFYLSTYFILYPSYCIISDTPCREGKKDGAEEWPVDSSKV